MENNPQSINIVRTFNAPIAKVWEAWTIKEAWAKWYGHPWENPADKIELDVRPGGAWKSTTIADGNTIHFTGKYLEVEKPNKLVLTFEDPNNPANPDHETVIVTFK